MFDLYVRLCTVVRYYQDLKQKIIIVVVILLQITYFPNESTEEKNNLTYYLPSGMLITNHLFSHV